MNIAQILTSVQNTSANHYKYVKELEDLLTQDGTITFLENFKRCILHAFKTDMKIKNPFLERLYDFCILFIVTVESNNEKFEIMNEIFDTILNCVEKTSVEVKFNACIFIFKYIRYLFNEDKTINQDLFEKIAEAILDSLEDTNPLVRATSAKILKHLQGPEDPFSPALVDNLGDTNGKVRAAIVDALIPNARNLTHIVDRCRDIDEQVRITVFKKVSDIPVQKFQIVQRQFLLKSGLKDRSERVRKCVKQTIVPSWLKYYDCDYLTFLKALQLDSDDEEISNTKTVSELVLKSLFSTQPIQEILEALHLEERLIPLDQLTWESTLFWKHLIAYLKTNNLEQYWELIIPETVIFCEYLKSFNSTSNSLNDSKWEEQLNSLIFSELLNIALDCDISDEASRRKIYSLLDSMLREKKLSQEIINDVVKYYQRLIPNVERRVNYFCEMISDIRMPFSPNDPSEELLENDEKKRELTKKLQQLLTEKLKCIEDQEFEKANDIKLEITATKEILQTIEDTSTTFKEEIQEKNNDPEIVAKCLDIILSVLDSPQIDSITPVLESLRKELFTELMTCENSFIQTKYLRCYGAICCLDKTITEQNIQLFCLTLTLYCKEKTGDPNVVTAAIDSIGDFLLVHGSKILPIDEEQKDFNRSLVSEVLFEKDETTLKEVINYLSLLLDEQSPIRKCCKVQDSRIKKKRLLWHNKDTQIRHSACEVLIKLMLTKRIESPELFSRFFIKWMNPATAEDTRFRQSIGIFIETFSQLPDVEMQLEESVIPTLITFGLSPPCSPLSNVSKDDMIKCIIKIINLRHDEDYTIHENLALRICVEIQKDYNSNSVPLLVKTLLFLELYRDDKVYIDDLLNVCEDILIDLHDQISVNNMKKFIFSLKHE